MGWAKLLIRISTIAVFLFLPMIEMPYEVVVQKQVEEEYATIEPYTITEKVREPYYDWAKRHQWVEGTSSRIGHWETVDYQMTKYRIVERPITKYREVTKTRLVTRPVVETRTKRVSILRYLLR